MSVNTTRVLIRHNLHKRALSVRELADSISVTAHCIRRNLNVMRAADEVYVSSWVRYFTQGPWAAVYSLGYGRDKPAPAAVSDAERMRRRRRDHPDIVLNEIMYKRKARAAKRVIKAKPEKPQSWRIWK